MGTDIRHLGLRLVLNWCIINSESDAVCFLIEVDLSA